MKRTIAAILAGIMLMTTAGCQQEDTVTTMGPAATTAPAVALPTDPTVPTGGSTEPAATTDAPTQPTTDASTQPTTDASTQPTTQPEPVPEGMIGYNGNHYESLGQIISMLQAVSKLQAEYSDIVLEGLQTPVTLHMNYYALEAVTAFGQYFPLDHTLSIPDSQIYDFADRIILNVWREDGGSTVIISPDGCTMWTASQGVETMVYADEAGDLRWKRTNCNFLDGIDKWATMPLDLATSRDVLYYATGPCTLRGQQVVMLPEEHYTISDVCDLDDLFAQAKSWGYYEQFDTLDQLLAWNWQDQHQLEEDWSEAGWHEVRQYDDDGTLRRRTQYLGDREANVWIYDEQGRLTCRELYGCYHLDTVIDYTYDGQGNLIREDFGDYSYTMEYDEQGNMTKRTRWEDGKEDGCQVFTYTDGVLTGEVFWQGGQRKYSYRFDASGALTGHVTYVDGVAVETEDLSSLVRVQLLLDAWMPITDNCPKSFSFDYDGTGLIRKEGHVDESWEITYDGSYYRPLRGWFDASYDSGEITHEHIYKDGQRVETVMREDGVEFARYTYVNDQWSRPVEEVRYEDGQEVYRQEYHYDDEQRIVTVTYRGSDGEVQRYQEYCGSVVEQLPYYDGYAYTFDGQGMLRECFIFYDDWFAGTALYDCRIVYVPAVEAQALDNIWADVLLYL